jgi:hypothetical protein
VINSRSLAERLVTSAVRLMLGELHRSQRQALPTLKLYAASQWRRHSPALASGLRRSREMLLS